jgi:hypothetical protein
MMRWVGRVAGKRDRRIVYAVWVEEPESETRRPGVDEENIKINLNKAVRRAWSGLIWLSMRTNDRVL